MTPPLTAPSMGNKHQPQLLCSQNWGCSAVLDVWAQQGGHLERDTPYPHPHPLALVSSHGPLDTTGEGVQGAGGDEPSAGGTQPAPLVQLVEQLGLGARGCWPCGAFWSRTHTPFPWLSSVGGSGRGSPLVTQLPQELPLTVPSALE